MIQESGLTEIIPLICASAFWGQSPVFSHPEFPQAPLSDGGGGASSSLMAVSWRSFFVIFLSSLGSHHQGGYNVVAGYFVY